MTRILLAIVIATGAASVPATAAKTPQCSSTCVKRVKARDYASTHGGCYTPACTRRVHRKAEAREMRRYKAAPMPRCTWYGESGPGPEYAPSRYRALNPTSGAGGKYQIIPSTWRSVGGTGLAHLARPVIQERLARRVLRAQGIHAWVLC